MTASDDPYPVVMIQIEWWSRSSLVMLIQIERWSRSSPMMLIQIEWWSRSSDDIQWWWSRSSDDPYLEMKMTWRWRWLEYEDDLKMQMTRWSREEDQWWKLCPENTFLVKREYWCNCNSGMYSLVFLIYCNPMFILRCTYVMSCPNVPIGRIYNVSKSCQVIVGNPPIV